MKQIHIRIINHSSCFVHNFFSFFRKWDERSVPEFLHGNSASEAFRIGNCSNLASGLHPNRSPFA